MKNIYQQQLQILAIVGKDLWGAQMVQCLCSCGQTTTARKAHITAGRIKSCGCLRKRSHQCNNWKHGLSRSREYKSWVSMKDRCNNPANSGYLYYGGRGITYDPQWENFEVFVKDMGLRPDGTTLDRIDNALGYQKANCRWATPSVQQNNRRNVIKET